MKTPATIIIITVVLAVCGLQPAIADDQVEAKKPIAISQVVKSVAAKNDQQGAHGGIFQPDSGNAGADACKSFCPLPVSLMQQTNES